MAFSGDDFSADLISLCKQVASDFTDKQRLQHSKVLASTESIQNMGSRHVEVVGKICVLRKEVRLACFRRHEDRLDSFITQSRGTQDSSVALPVSTTTARW